MKKVYYLFFYKLHKFFKSVSEDEFSAWKSVLIIQTLQIFVLFIFILQIELISKISVFPNGDPRIFAVPFGIILAIFNYYVFLYHKGWKAYEDEFNKYSKQKNIVINLAIFCVVFGILLGLIFTFYQMSQIDWSKYD